MLTEPTRRPHEFDQHREYLAERWQLGCTNAALLSTEPGDRSYHGSERSVRRLLHTWRVSVVSPTAVPPATPKPRQVTGWIFQAVADRTNTTSSDAASSSPTH
jgi:hypothetical protein